VDSTLLDPVAQEKNEAVIAEVIRTRLGSNTDLSKMMGALPMARFSDQLIPLAGAMRDFSREVGGIQQALFGGGPPDPTWRAASQRKNQALMQLQPTFDEMQFFVSEISRNGIRELARYGTEQVKVAETDVNGAGESQMLNLAMLQEDGWHVEAEESFPMSFGEKVDRVTEIAKENPMLADTIGLTHPMSAHTVQQMFGVDGLYVRGEHERQRALNIIRRLCKEQPIVTVDPMTGQPIERPSIEPAPFEEKDHAFFAEFTRGWCNSPAGMRLAEENPQGYRNVQLWGTAQDEAAAMAAMPPPAVAPGGPGPAGGESPAPVSPMPPASQGPEVAAAGA